jgi:putative MFS transporter
MSRIGAAAGTFLLPVCVEYFGVYTALAGCAAVTLLSGIVCQMWAPETSTKHNKQGSMAYSLNHS